MSKEFIENIHYKGGNFTENPFKMTEYENCTFSNCIFYEANLSDAHFTGNSFLLAFNFEACTLNFSSFYQLKIKNTLFKDCKLEEVDFIEADLTNAIFRNCDLIRAVFDRTKLGGADFRASYNFSIDPELNPIFKAKFSSQTIGGLLNKYKIVIE